MKAALVLALCAMGLDVSAAVAASPAPLSPAVKQGYDAGFRDCSAPLNSFVKFVHEDDERYAYFGRWSADHPNEEAFNSLTSETFTDGKSVTSFTASKNSRGKCDVSFTQTIIVADTICSKVRTDAFKDWKTYGELNGDKIYEDPTSANANALLVPIGQTGCLITKTFVAFGLEPGAPAGRK